MARGRIISKSQSTSEKFASLAETAGALAEFCQALYPLLVIHADDFGRLQGDAFTVKHVCFPVSPRSITQFSQALQLLDRVKLVRLYSVDNKTYLQVDQFDTHQSGLTKRTKSKFPDIPGNSGIPVNFTEIPSEEKRTELNGRELNGTEENGTESYPINQPEREIGSSTTTAPKSVSLSPAAPPQAQNIRTDPFTDSVITERAARFIERYGDLYSQKRNGARYASKIHRDYAAAVTLCQTWGDDERLDKLAVCFLTTDHRFAEEGSRTIPQFLALASWCDSKLAEWEKARPNGGRQ